MILSALTSGRLRKIAAIAALLWVFPCNVARADVTADVNGDGRDDRIAILAGDGGATLRLNLADGGTFWLDAPKPVLQLAAIDLDHDGDIDLIATTDGVELLAWLNLGQGGFVSRIIDPKPPRPLTKEAASLRRFVGPHILEFSIGADDAILPALLLSSPLCGQLRATYSGPSRLTPISVPYGSRAPPLL